MNRIGTLLSLFLLSCMTGISQNIRHTELLGRPTANSITVQTFFDDSVEVSVEYGTVSGVYGSQTPWQLFSDTLPNVLSEVVISGLQADTKYYYRLRHRAPGAASFTTRPEYTFHTQRGPASSFTFIVQADPHLDDQSDSALYRLCLQNELADEPDFMIDLGDFLMTDKLRDASNTVPHDTIPYRCELLRSYYEVNSHSVPLYIALGNHEGEAGWYRNGTANNIAIWDSEERMRYFPNPAPDSFYTGDTTQNAFVGIRENYYAWNWGNALFIVLDPYWYTQPKPDSLHGWYWTLGKTQYDWLKSTLENSTAEFRFVFAHQLVGGDPEGRGGVEFADRYEWGGKNLDGTSGFATQRPGWYKPIKDLLTEHRVNIFFHGHDHFFGKQEKDCLIYQETPQPSHPNFNSASQAATYGYYQGQILPNSGHLRVNVGPTGLRVDYVRAYLPQNENGSRHNRDVSATYFIGTTNCYDSVATGVPVLWNQNYVDELAYPNPFSTETYIRFQLGHEEVVHLDIRDPNGKLVRRLIDGSSVPAGDFHVIWDGRDGAGNDVSDGTYFYTLKGETTGVKTGKLALIRN